jgi:integrase
MIGGFSNPATFAAGADARSGSSPALSVICGFASGCTGAGLGPGNERTYHRPRRMSRHVLLEKYCASTRHKGVEGRGDSIRIRFKYRGRRSETIRLEPTKANLKYAAQLRGEIQRKIAIGTFRYADYFPDSKYATDAGTNAVTFKAMSQAWLDSADLAKATREGYEKSLKKYAWPRFGDTPIDKVTELEILQALAQVKASKKTRNNTLIPIRRTFRLAKLNTAAGVEYSKHQSPAPDPFEPEEVEAILAKMFERYGSEVANYFGLGFFAGPRPSEHIAFRWDDLSLKTGTWTVKRAKVRGEEKATKTAQERDHKLSGRALAYLEAQRQFTQMRGSYVFLDLVTGQQYNDDKPPRERYWKPVLKAVGVRYRPPEQMRHTYITMAIMAGANPVWVARQAGNSPRVIFKHYAKWIERADRSREAAKVEEYLGQIWGKTVTESGGNDGGTAEGNSS